MPTTAEVPSKAKETPAQAFVRLAARRLHRSQEELRLVSQLSGRTYESTKEQAEDLLGEIDASLHNIARSFNIDYASRIGRHDSRATGEQAQHTSPNRVNTPAVIDAIEATKMLEAISKGDGQYVVDMLRRAVLK